MSSPGPVPDWQRLDPRMLLVHPVLEVLRFLPVLLGIVIAGRATGGDGPWAVIGVAVAVALGLLRYLTTGYRITAGRVELRTGLLNRHVLVAPLDRVRTVDLTASPIHRVLGLSTVRIGTGTAATREDEGISLDSLPTPRARALRQELLRRTPAQPGEEPEAPPTERVVVRFHPSWLAYAPFTTAGLVIGAGIGGLAAQVVGDVDVEIGPEALPDASWVLLVPLLVVGGVLVVSALAVVGYAVTNWGYTLGHTAADGAWHLRRGLLTTRETSIDDDRVRGVSMATPLGLRLARGARLSVIATGLERGAGSATLVPPAPHRVVDDAAAQVLGSPAPVRVPLVSHGPRARTRRYVRAVWPGAVVALALVAAVLWLEAPAWLLAAAVVVLLGAVALGRDRWQALGHALVDDWFTVRSGSLARRQAVLETRGIIGWNLRSTWFQRRAGLTTLVATTAGGRQAYAALDVPEATAVAVADAAVPGLVEQFLERPPGADG